jgi:hypothetical protein
MVSDPLSTLQDERDVIAVITELFIRTDRRDWPEVERLFAPSVHFDMTSLAGGSPAAMEPRAIVEGWKTGLAPLEAVHHQAGNFQVRLRGEEADASCYGIAFHYRKTRSGRNTRTFVGTYDFGLRRSSAAWVITRFRFDAKFVDGNRELEKEP